MRGFDAEIADQNITKHSPQASKNKNIIVIVKAREKAVSV